jgi:hypothetical protein
MSCETRQNTAQRHSSRCLYWPALDAGPPTRASWGRGAGGPGHREPGGAVRSASAGARCGIARRELPPAGAGPRDRATRNGIAPRRVDPWEERLKRTLASLDRARRLRVDRRGAGPPGVGRGAARGGDPGSGVPAAVALEAGAGDPGGPGAAGPDGEGAERAGAAAAGGHGALGPERALPGDAGAGRAGGRARGPAVGEDEGAEPGAGVPPGAGAGAAGADRHGAVQVDRGPGAVRGDVCGQGRPAAQTCWSCARRSSQRSITARQTRSRSTASARSRGSVTPKPSLGTGIRRAAS